MRAAWCILAAGLVGACQRPPPPAPAPSPPPSLVVPEGCLADLSGEWEHAVDRSWRYHALDDGGTLTLEVTRVELPDARFHPRHFRDAGPAPSDAGATDAGEAAEDAGVPSPRVQLVLERTRTGFVGQTRVTVRHPQGRDCEAVFPAEVLDCRDGGLLISATAAVTLDDACQPPAASPPGPAPRHALRRLAAP